MDDLMKSALNAAALRPEGVRVSDEDIAHHQGRDAFLDGYSDDLNPYPRGILWDAWIDGWEFEYAKHGREVDSDEQDREFLKRRT